MRKRQIIWHDRRLFSLLVLKDTFCHEASEDVVVLLDGAARRSGLDRTRVFDDFLHIVICTLSGGRMEQQYLRVIEPYSAGKPGRRAIDVLSTAFSAIVLATEQTRADGDVFEGAITRGQNSQFFTPDPVCRMMAQMIDRGKTGETVCDPTCGSGRILLAAAQINRDREFVGQDVDLRCVRITAINLALWNLYGWVIHGNSLALEKKLVYRTGFDGQGFVREVPPEDCPIPVPVAPAPKTLPPLRESTTNEGAIGKAPTTQKSLFD